MPRPYPKEFRDDVVRVVRNRERRCWAPRSATVSPSSSGLLQEQVTQLVTRPDRPVWS